MALTGRGISTKLIQTDMPNAFLSDSFTLTYLYSLLFVLIVKCWNGQRCCFKEQNVRSDVVGVPSAVVFHWQHSACYGTGTVVSH